MTKIKNTKKGMAKKTLSMSLVVAMLATSNVPVWAAEFSDGSEATVATEADTFAAEAPVVDDTEESTPASVMVNEADITLNLSADSKKVVWGDASVISGTVTKTDGSEVEGGWQYRWVDENGIAYVASNGKVNDAYDMSLNTTADMAGKTLTLYVYDVDSNQQTLYDINTGISVAVEKRALKTVTATPDTTNKAYNGFAQTITDADGVKFAVKDSEYADVDSDAYETSVTNATNNKEKFKLTVTAKEDSAYTGSAEVDLGQIVKKNYEKTDIEAHTTKGQSYQYTGNTINVSKDKVTLKESVSDNKGEDGKLNGADLSKAIESVAIYNTGVGEYPVSIITDVTKFDNIKVPGNAITFTTPETVTVAKRDLSTAGTKITVNTLSGQIPTNIAVSELANYLTFTGVEGTDLSAIEKSSKEYTLIVKNADGTDAKQFKNGSTYTVTVRAKDNGNCTGEQTFTVVATAAALNAVSAKTQYVTSYTGDEIKPSKSDLGDLVIQYYTATGQPKTEDLGPDGYEITGYTNNINATTRYSSKGTTFVPVADSYVNIKITSGTYKDQTATIPFLIKPLVVEPEYVTVPEDVSINKALTAAGDYKLPVTVVAKDDETGKKVEKTLTENDFTVKYEYKNKDIANDLYNNIITKVTVTNTNYILKTADGKTRTVTAKGQTQIVPKKLTDAMVVVTPSTYTYTGGKIQPTYAVVDGAIALYKKGEVNDKNAEYEEVSISNAVNVGTGTITVKGCNDFYSGKATGTFTITAANTADVKVAIADQDYTGKQVRPRKFTATLNGNDVSDQFEIVSYGENVEAGTGTVVLKPLDGNKNFTGSNITANFNIVKEKIKADISVYDDKGFDVTKKSTATVIKDSDENVIGVTADSKKPFTFDGNAHTFAKALLSNIEKVTPDGVKTTAKESDFEIKYADNITGKFISNGKENIGYIYAVAKEGTGFAGTKTIVTSDGTIINGVVAYIPFSIKSVKFVAKNVSIKNGTYAAGLQVKPEVLIQIGGSTLVEGKDYTLRLIDNAGNTVTPIDTTVGNIYGIEVKGINGYMQSCVATTDTAYTKANLTWGVDKKNINDCTVTVKDGVVTVLNGYLPVASTEYTSEKNADGTYTVKANSASKNYTGSKTVSAEGKAEDEKPDAPMISKVAVTGNKATVILSGDSEGAAGYDYVISTDRDCITNKDYTSVNKNQVSTSTTFKYVQQETYYAYCHAWKRDENGKKVFSDWSNAYPFVVSAITPDAPVITNVKVSGTTVKVTYKAAKNATGYDVVLGTSSKKENGETRPYHYGDHKVLNLKEGTVTATFKNVPKGSWTVGMHAFNRTSENGKKVFSPWSNLKKITVK